MADPTPDLPAADSVSDPETWDYLARHRARKQRCLEDALRIQETCARDPGHAKTPAADCRPCHRRTVDRIARRYLDGAESEWYAGRRTFLQHLAELFPAVRRGEVDASGIEDRVMDEKRRWLRERVRRVAVDLGALGLPDRKDEVLRLLADAKLDFGEFCARVREVTERGVEPCPPGSLERLIATRNDPQARVEAEKEIFFYSYRKWDEVAEFTRKYVDMLDQGMSMTKVSSRMVEDRKQGIADRAEVERLQSRIEYLKKAKATWLAQRKSRDADEEKPRAWPPCFRCGQSLEVVDPLSCSICQLAVAHGLQEDAVVYCGVECQRLGHGDHVSKAHRCAAVEHCVTLYQPEEAEHGDPSDSEGDAYLCKECLEHNMAIALFCTIECADANLKYHRAEVHKDYGLRSGAGGGEDFRAYLVTLEQALQDMQARNVIDQLSFVPKFRHEVESPKADPAHGAATHFSHDGASEPGDDQADAHAVTPPADKMEVDTEKAEEVEETPANLEPAPSSPHGDDAPGGDKMEGVETHASPGPVHDHKADADADGDAEMLDAVDVADFAVDPERAEKKEPIAATDPEATESSKSAPVAEPEPAKEKPQPAKKEPAPAVEEPAVENAAESSTETPAEPRAAPAEPQPEQAAEEEAPTTAARPDRATPPPPVPGASDDNSAPETTVPVVVPKAAQQVVRQPRSETVVAAEPSPSQPAKVTSVEPMPSLGRSLEVEIARIVPAAEDKAETTLPEAEAGPAAAQTTGGNGPLPEEVLARNRSANVEAMDRIAEAKAADLDAAVVRLATAAAPPKEGVTDVGAKTDGMLPAGGEAVAERALGKQAVDLAVLEAGNEKRAAEAESVGGGGETGEKGEPGAAIGVAPVEEVPAIASGEKVPAGPVEPLAGSGAEKDDAKVVEEAVNAREDKVPKPSAEAAGAVEPKTSPDAKEDGEISSSDEADKKRKASVAPGDVRDNTREAKRVRSVDPADGSEQTPRD